MFFPPGMPGQRVWWRISGEGFGFGCVGEVVRYIEARKRWLQVRSYIAICEDQVVRDGLCNVHLESNFQYLRRLSQVFEDTF